MGNFMRLIFFFAFFEKIVVPILTSGGYVGLLIATLLSQHHKVYAVDIIPEKVELINSRKSPIQDEYIEKYLAEKELDLTATLDAKLAYSNTDLLVFFLDFTLFVFEGTEEKLFYTDHNHLFNYFNNFFEGATSCYRRSNTFLIC